MARKATHWTTWFWEKVELTDDHWWWRGACLASGHGQFTSIKNRAPEFTSTLAHRIAYQLLVAVPSNELHHLCNEPSCVNPVHLLDVTRHEHVQLDQRHLRQRVENETNRNMYIVWSQGKCYAGHDLSEVGWYVYPNGRRSCRECRRQGAQRYRDRLKGEDL